MSNLWVNIRFGSWHLQIGPDGLSWGPNCFHEKGSWARAQPGWKWFEIYEP